MTRHVTPHPRPPGHPLVAAATIGGLSMILAAGLELLGVLNRLNAGIAQLVARNGAETFPRQLPDWSIWLATASFAFGLAVAILGSPGHGRRLLLWITAMFLVAAWAPVLSLAAHAPAIAAPWIATLWSGICAMVYATNHRMACDDNPPASHDPR
ncbi:MAG: hypothetical protein WCJ14_09840 [Verrucomicrobiota bacterium]